MSAVNVYADTTNINSAGRWITMPTAAESGGSKVKTLRQLVAVAAADSDGSIYRVFKNIDSNLTVIGVRICNGTITGGTDWDLGFYPPDLATTPYDKDALMDGADLSTAHAMNAPLNGLSGVSVANAKKRIWELCGLAEYPPKIAGVDICLTANTVGSAADTILVEIDVQTD